MGTCHTCGNQYDKTFRVEMAGRKFEFDSFECAIQALAPHCSRCETRIIGHGLEARGQIFCCANCAEAAGETALRDRA
jgi:hypothetical protein